MATVPDKALVLAVTKQMLYEEETPLVGVGLMYKLTTFPRSLSVLPTCICMCGMPQAPVWSQQTN